MENSSTAIYHTFCALINVVFWAIRKRHILQNCNGNAFSPGIQQGHMTGQMGEETNVFQYFQR